MLGRRLVFNLLRLSKESIPKEEVAQAVANSQDLAKSGEVFLYCTKDDEMVSWSPRGRLYLIYGGTTGAVVVVEYEGPSPKINRLETEFLRLSDYNVTWFLHRKGLNTGSNNEV